MHTARPKFGPFAPGGRIVARPWGVIAPRPAIIAGGRLLDAVTLDQPSQLTRGDSRGVLDVIGQLSRRQVVGSTIAPRAKRPIFGVAPTAIGPIPRKARQLLREPGAAARDSARREPCFSLDERQQPGQREPRLTSRANHSQRDPRLLGRGVTRKAGRFVQLADRVSGNLPIRGVTCETRKREDEKDCFQHDQKHARRGRGTAARKHKRQKP